MQKDGDKLNGTTLDTTMTLESVKSKDQQTQSSQQSGGGGGLSGMLAKKIMKKNDSAAGGKSTIFTSRHQYLEISKSVDTADLAIPAGFKDVTKK